MLQIVKPDIAIDFIKMRKIAFVLSAAVIVGGIASLVAKGGPNYGIDFTGGLMLHVGLDPDVSIADVREAVAVASDEDISVQEFGSQPGEYLLRVPAGDAKVGGGRAADIKTALREQFAERGFDEKRTEIVGPRVGKELRRRGLLSVLFATLVMGA